MAIRQKMKETLEMNTAARPLELRLRSELDLSGTRRFETESRAAVVGQLTRATSISRRRLFALVVPIVILATAAIAFAITY